MSAGTRMILALNCGSSSVKFALFAARGADVPRQPVWKDRIDAGGGASPCRSAMAQVLERTRARLGGRAPDAVSHRVVHGGEQYTAPVRVDAAVLADLTRYVALAPLHQPFALEAIAALMADHPRMPQVACFDTAFHHTLPRVEQLLPLPPAVRACGLRRYGFHGLSYEYMAQVLPERYGEQAHGRVIVAHLGSGASLCALHAGRSVATSMGFSALDGLMMATRSGSLDPGVLLYLLEYDRMTVAGLTHMLYHESGLAGMSGLSPELPVLLANEARTDDTGTCVRDALALYVRRIVREIGALVAVLGGLDMLVFTAGVGEHSAAIRERVCGGLAFLGIAIDDAANQACRYLISAPASPVTVAMEPTDEEWIAARHAAGLLHNDHDHDHDQSSPSQGDRPCP